MQNKPEKWTGNLLGRMHNEKITNRDLAKELGVSSAYISQILNGNRKPDGIKQRMDNAVSRIIEKREN